MSPPVMPCERVIAGTHGAEYEKERRMTRKTTAIPEFGYRDEEFGGSGEHDPKRVCLYELTELGNVDVPLTIVERYSTKLKAKDLQTLLNVIRDQEKSGLTGNDASLTDEYTDLIERICDGRDFCIWLCRTPHEYFKAYVDAFDDDTEMRRDRIASVCMSRYAIPESAIVLSDDPTEGMLLAWKSDGHNTLPVEKDIDFEAYLSPIEREPDCFPGTSVPMSRGNVRVMEFDRFGQSVAQPEFAVHMGDEDDLRDWPRLSMKELLGQVRNTTAFSMGHTFIVDDNRLGEPVVVSADIDERIDMEGNGDLLIHTATHSKEKSPNNIVTTQPADSQCPFCGGLIDDADMAEMTRRYNRAYAEQTCRCPECDAEWVDQYLWRRAVRV